MKFLFFKLFVFESFFSAAKDSLKYKKYASFTKTVFSLHSLLVYLCSIHIGFCIFSIFRLLIKLFHMGP